MVVWLGAFTNRIWRQQIVRRNRFSTGTSLSPPWYQADRCCSRRWYSAGRFTIGSPYHSLKTGVAVMFELPTSFGWSVTHQQLFILFHTILWLRKPYQRWTHSKTARKFGILLPALCYTILEFPQDFSERPSLKLCCQALEATRDSR